MKIYSENKNYKLYQGSMLDMLDNIKENSIDSIVTDPPYELNFMGKGWDNAGISFNKATWSKCYEVLKPGGYLLAFGGSRTFHRIAVAIEDAGFEIRDTIMWLYGSGFPKSQNISKILDKKFGKERPIIGYTDNAGIAKNEKPDSTGSHIWSGNITSDEPITDLAKQWHGWGTALKPSFEPIIVARKPFKGSLVDNVIKYGVGGINIDECRVPFNGDKWKAQKSGSSSRAFQSEKLTTADGKCEANDNGRFPANTILTYDETDFDEVCGGFPYTHPAGNKNESNITKGNSMFGIGGIGKRNPKIPGDNGGSASRYFYCAKASKKDRDEGLDKFEEVNGESYLFRQDGSLDGQIPARKNTHPTVKPTTLMQYLVRLVTPNGGIVLDPFNGSGSTGKAVMYENKEHNKNYKYIGIELTDEYLPIAKARIEYVDNEIKKEI